MSADTRNHGGPRPGAGRKPSYGEPTTTLRVPRSKVTQVASFLERFKQGEAIESVTPLRPVSFQSKRCNVAALGRRVRAGRPSSGDDAPEEPVDLGSYLVRDKDSTFLMKVSGWSMRDAGIADKDELVVDRSLAFEPGRIVIAEVNGELTVKRLRRSEHGWVLEAANPDFADIVIDDRDELRVWGVVTRLIRTL